MKAPARVLGFACLALTALLLTACSGEPAADSGGSSDTPDSTFVLEDTAAVEQAIVAAEGGSIEVTSSTGAIVRISFPRGSLAEDVTLVAAPLAEDPLGDDNVVVPGFSLEVKGTGAGPELVYPAFVSMIVDGELPELTSLVRYADDASGYDVVPTTIASSDGKTQLVAQVDHFSAYGGMNITQDEKDEAAQQQSMQDFDWVVYINDTAEVDAGYLTQTIQLDLSARCTGGNIMGNYTGSASAVTTNEGDIGGGHVSATANSSSTHLEFSIGPSLAPLTEPEEDEDLPLAPLTNEQPDFTGYGSIGMATAGDGTYTKNGLAAGGTFGNDSSLPLEIYINGPQARLALISPQGMVYWDGYIIGEGR